MSNLQTEWTKHIRDAEKKKSAVETIKASNFALSLYRDILDRELAKIQLDMTSEKSFSNPNWQNATAYRLGMLEGLNRARKHLSFLDHKE